MAVMVSAIVGLMRAYNRFGIWSLVVSQLCSQIMTVIGYWYMVKWRPLGYFSLERVRILFNYSSKVLLGSLFNVVYNNVYNLVIGKQYNTIMLGYYNRSMLIPTLIVDSAANTLNSVMFPALSSLQDDKIQIKISFDEC